MSKLHSFLTTGLCALTLLNSASFASEESMNKALSAWQREYTEYQAAITYAKTDEERAALQQNGPNGQSIAAALWKSISERVGYKEVEEASSEPADRFNKKKTKKVPIYGYEQSWATPAISWLLNHPLDLEKALEGSPANKVITALLKSIQSTHFDQVGIADACATLSGINNIQAYQCLEKIYMRNPSEKARACAALGMSILLQDEQIRNHEGSEEMARAKRVYYIKAALNIAPEKCMFGDLSLDEVALEQIYLITKLEEGCIPPSASIATVDNKELSIPLVDQAQLIFFWTPSNGESILLIKRFKELSEKYPLIKIIAVAPPLSREELREVYEKEAIDYPTFVDKDLSASQNYRIPTAPYVIFVDEKGKLLYRGAPDLNLQTKIALYIEGLKSKANDASQLQQVRDNYSTQPSPTGESKSIVPELREMPEL